MGEALRRREGRGSGRVGQESIFAVELVADAEVGDLDLAGVGPQQVARLQIPVDDLLVVD